ncbi:MAG TPA: penicillin-binding transpeptidase domain-containing protein [Ktedonobacterales bacterium]|jgi:peptidoglycan glycosyltransferase
MERMPSRLSWLALVLVLATLLSACDTTPPYNGLRGSIYDRTGTLLAYSVADSSASGGYRRHYCIPSLSPVIGYFGASIGKTGIEQAFDAQLSRGDDLYLTIDWRVQNLLDKEYDITYDNPGNTLRAPFPKLPQGTVGMDPTAYAQRARCPQGLASQLYVPPAETAAHYHPGSANVEDPKTGEILGMLSRPYFDAEKLTDPATGVPSLEQASGDRLTPLLNRATDGLYTPGATFEAVTLAAALDSGKYQLNTPFGGRNCLAPNSEARSYTVNSLNFRDIDLLTYNPPPACPINLEHGYIYSDNIIFARVGVGLGADTWLDYAQRFGVTDAANPKSFPFDIPAKASSIPFQGNQGVTGDDHQVDLAASAFGQGALQVTPLTTEFITSTVANNGLALKPHLFYKLVPQGANPNNLQPAAPQPYGGNNGQIISPQTAGQIRQAMLGVVTQGSAGIISGSRANVGGKTGTAQLCQNCSQEPHSWFTALAPDGPGQTPQYAITVMRENADEGLLQASVADCLFLSLLPGIGNTPLQNIHDGTAYPRYHCAP